MNTLKTSFINFWTAQVDSRPLAVCRILTGITCLLMFLSYIPNLQKYFYYSGIHHTPLSLNKSTGYILSLLNLQKYSLFEDWLVVVLLILGIISAVLFIVGYYTRVNNIILFIIFMSFANFSLLVRNAEDGLLVFLLLLMSFVNSGSSYSLDSKLNKIKNKTISVYPVRLIQISMLMLYIFLGIDKITEEEWRTGEALYWILAVTPYSDFADWDIFRNELITKLMTWSAICIELLAPIGLLFKRTRLISIVFLVLLHLGIIFMMGRFVMIFNLATLAGLATFWHFKKS